MTLSTMGLQAATSLPTHSGSVTCHKMCHRVTGHQLQSPLEHHQIRNISTRALV
jgi:hypothetical protein